MSVSTDAETRPTFIWLSDHHGVRQSKFHRVEDYKLIVTARFPDHFSAEGGKPHAERRRIVTNVYTMTSILQSEQYIEKCIDVWLEKLGEMSDEKKSFDLWLWTRMWETRSFITNNNI
jgi:cytochrome P450